MAEPGTAARWRSRDHDHRRPDGDERRYNDEPRGIRLEVGSNRYT
jgi:hypothetical protein